jgi:hypothetical protein
MGDDTFEVVEQVLRGSGPEAGFDLLLKKFRDEKKYPLVFEARLLKKRHELKLPLIQAEPAPDLPTDVRRAYDEEFIAAARDVGALFLGDGNIQRAWPYFRAIGETAPIAAAIEQFKIPEQGESQDTIDPLIEIALHERVHPRKGFELILANYGTCRAITMFEQYPGREGRDDSLRLLVRTLHNELVESLKRAIARQEGQAPDTRSVPQLIEGREWLFGEYDYYVDTSHLVSILRFSMDLTDRETLALAVELTAYGKRLSPMFHYRGDPPFENMYEDYSIYLRALLGQDVETAIAHFRNKITEADPDADVSGPAQVLVGLLARLQSYTEAIDVSLKYLRDVGPGQLGCPPVLQLCQSAGDYTRLKELAREQGDLLSFAAAVIQG